MRVTSPALLLVARNLRVGERAWGPTLVRFLIAGAALLVLWTAQSTRFATGGPGGQILAGLAWLDQWGLIIAGISLFPSLVTEEREQQSLPLLRLAGFGAAGFLLGQSFSAFAYCALVLAVQVPFLMLAVTLGGTSVTPVLATLLVLAVTASLVYAAALLAGAWARSARSAARTAGLLVASVTFLPGTLAGLETRVLGTSHLATFAQSLAPALLEQAHMPVLDWPLLRSALGLQLGLAALFLLLAFVVFERRQADAPTATTARVAVQRGRYPTGPAAFAALADRGPGRWSYWRFVALGHLGIAALVLLTQGTTGVLGIVGFQILIAAVNMAQLATTATSRVRSQRVAGLLLLAGGDDVWLRQQRVVRARVFAVHLAAVLLSCFVIVAVLGHSLETVLIMLSSAVGISFFAARLGEFCGLAYKRAPMAVTLLGGMALIAIVNVACIVILATGRGGAEAYTFVTFTIYVGLGLVFGAASKARLAKVYAE
ncbi:MAG: hypothetical protein R3F56_23190 [Planctomycetota bacterium]